MNLQRIKNGIYVRKIRKDLTHAIKNSSILMKKYLFHKIGASYAVRWCKSSGGLKRVGGSKIRCVNGVMRRDKKIVREK
jgi:hypothetical protein